MFFLCLLSVALCGWHVSPATDLQPLFNARKGAGVFLGADVATSIPVSPTKSVWLFGDTLVGKIGSDGSRDLVKEPIFPRNSVGVATTSAPLPAPSDVTFHWSTNTEGQPDSLLMPPKYDRFSNYIWAFSTHFQNERLYIFGSRMTNTTDPTFPFKTVDSVVFRVDNPLADPSLWKPAYSVLPSPDPSKVTWGDAVSADDDHVYIYGQSSLNGKKHVLLSRLASADLEAFSWEHLQYYAGNDGWSNDVTDAAPVVGRVPGETTVHYISWMKKWVSLSFHAFLSSHVYMYTADAPEGPWAGEQLYTVPSPFNDTSSTFCYAVKVHPELALSSRELIFSFMCNMFDFPRLLESGHLSIYVPRMIRATPS